MVNDKKVALKGDVPETLRNKFKSLCAIKNITMSEALEDIVRKWINSHENTDTQEIAPELFLKMLAENKKPTQIQRGILADTLEIDVEMLNKLVDCIFQTKHGVDLGVPVPEFKEPQPEISLEE